MQPSNAKQSGSPSDIKAPASPLGTALVGIPEISEAAGSQRLGRRPPGPLLSRLSVLTWLDLRGVTRLKPQLVAAAQARVRLALVPWLEQPRCYGGGDQLVAIS